MTRTSWFASETVEHPDQKPLTKPSREVQRLLKTAGPDRPDIRDLENFGIRRTRGDTTRGRTNSRSIEVEPPLNKKDLFDFLGPDADTSSPVSEQMGNPKNRKKKGGRAQSSSAWKIRCICGAREEGGNVQEAWIECNNCGNWQHNVCMGISTLTSEIPEKYDCQDCNPDAHQELLDGMDRKERPWETRRQEYEENLAAEERLSKKRKRTATSEDQVMAEGDISDLDPAFPLTDECHHYTRRRDVGWDIQKYWDQRYSIFSLYDEGIYMTDDSWFGVTPEPIANKVSDDLSALTSPTKTVLIDLFAGAGGNTIAFALSGRWDTIISIEKDPSVLACAQHNALIYGVSSKITWINADCFSYLSSPTHPIDPSITVIFASPPWGGPGYVSDAIFNLGSMQPYSVKHIHDAVRGMDSALFLPRTSDLRQIAKLVPKGKKIEVVQYCMEGASKALVAYIPAAEP